MARRKIGLLLGALSVALFASKDGLAGDPFPTRAEPIFSPGRNAASEDGSDAITLNPANLGFIPGAELRWTGVRCPDDAKKAGCGHAFGFAMPLLWNISTGLRFDVVQPPWGAEQSVGVGFPLRGYDYDWATWAVGVGLSDSMAIGMSIQRAYSSNPEVDGLVGVTAGVTLRPYRNFSFAAIAHDFNGPSTQVLPQTGLPLLDRSYVLSMAFRPTGKRDVEAGFEMKYFEGSDQWLPKATLAIDVPGVGRARGDVEVAHFPNDDRRSVIATAGLEIAFDHVTFGGGAFFGNGLGSPSDVGEYATASIASFRSPGVPIRTRAVFIKIDQTPSTRGHVALLRKLWAIANDSEISAVTLVMRAEPASSFARSEELADALRVLRARGKKSLCSWEEAGSRSIYVCASADRTVVNSAGGVRYAGLKMQYMYLAGLLGKIGVKAEFVRIGAHKSAPEEFTNEHGSDTARADYDDMLRQNEAVFLRNLELYRHISPDQFRAAAAKGIVTAQDARAAGLVNGYAFDDEVEGATEDLVGYKLPYEEYKDETFAPSAFGAQQKIAILYVDGDIVDGRSQHIPILDQKLVGSMSIVESIQMLRDDPTVRAVVLRIDSPGGSSSASEVMHRELELLARKKPLIVSMDSVAASGGYYIAAPARQIFASPLTVTGSIGIFFGKADVSGLLQKLGVNIDTYKTSPHADYDTLYRPWTPDEVAGIQGKIQHYYDIFLDRVSRGRHMSKAEVDAVGQGRVWTGQEALAHHLVDRMGGIRHALEAAREVTGLPNDTTLVEYPPLETSLFDYVLHAAGLSQVGAFSLNGLPLQLRDVARAFVPVAVFSGDTPLALMDYVPIGGGESEGP